MGLFLLVKFWWFSLLSLVGLAKRCGLRLFLESADRQVALPLHILVVALWSLVVCVVPGTVYDFALYWEMMGDAVPLGRTQLKVSVVWDTLFRAQEVSGGCH